MESLAITFDSGISGVSLKYQAHVQKIGWQDEVTATKDNTTFVGTKGQSRRLEALKLTVVGLDKLNAAGYEIKYRAHVQNIGWQEWVVADDKAYNEEKMNFAGTIGESKRIEAIQIAIVHKHQWTYAPEQNSNGVSTHVKLCSVCGEKTSEVCTFGEWLPTPNDNATVTRTCVCGNKQTKTLAEVLKDDSVKTIEVNGVNEDITVPAGKTLTIDNTVTSGKTITVDGTLILKKQQSSLKLKGTGNVIWAPEVQNATEFKTTFANTDFLKLSGNKLDSKATGDAKYLKYEIRVPELSTPQVIVDNDTDALTLGEDWDVTIDLGKNILRNSDKNTSSDLMVNKGTLTIKNGTIEDKNTGKTGKYVIKNESSGTLTLENVTLNSTSGNGVSNEGSLKMTDCKITGKKESSLGLKVGNGTNSDMSKNSTDLVGVTISNVQRGIGAGAKYATVNLKDTNISSTTWALGSLYNASASPEGRVNFNVDGGDFSVTGTGETPVALLIAPGNHTFKNCNLTGRNGMEVCGPVLTLDGVKITATKKPTDVDYTGVTKDVSNNNGNALLIRNLKGNKHTNDTTDVTINNSSLISTYGYAVSVNGNQKNAYDYMNMPETLRNINIKFDSYSTTHSNGSNKLIVVSPAAQSITNVTYGN